MRSKGADRQLRCYEMVGDLDEHAAEALRLEIHRLAKQYGVTVKKLSVEAATDATTLRRPGARL